MSLALKTPIGSPHPLPVVLTIAGSDSSGGAGIEADLKTFCAHGVYGITCITALTAQNTSGVSSIHVTPSDVIRSILQRNFDDFVYGYDHQCPLKVIKMGMLTKEAIEAVGEYMGAIKQRNIKIIVDPVMITSSGATLADEHAIQLAMEIMRLAYLITPNFPEAQTLFRMVGGQSGGMPYTSTVDHCTAIAKYLRDKIGCENVMVKGGHIPDAVANRIGDVVVHDREVTVFESQMIDSPNTHGTGCTLASSIAANTAKGQPLIPSVALAIDYVHRGLVNIDKLGHGTGPLNHLVLPASTIGEILHTPPVLDRFKSHPQIKPNWEIFTHHKFVRSLATNTLPLSQFVYFLQQDYYFLKNYIRVQGLALNSAPAHLQSHEINGINHVMDEISSHNQKIDSFNVSGVPPNGACLTYCEYLMKIAHTNDYWALKVAMAPCLHGYYQACYNVSVSHISRDSSRDNTHEIYYDYVSDSYKQAIKAGESVLQELDLTRIDEFVEIFNTVTKMEIEFWDQVLAYNPT